MGNRTKRPVISHDDPLDVSGQPPQTKWKSKDYWYDLPVVEVSKRKTRSKKATDDSRASTSKNQVQDSFEDIVPMKDFFNLPRSSHVQEVGLQENDFRWLFDCTIQDDPMDLIPDDCASDQEAPYTVIDIDIPLPNAALPKPTAQLPVSDFYPSLPPSRPVIESTATHGDMSASLVKPDIDITLNFPRNSKKRLQSPLESHDCLEIRPRKRARYVHNENANGTHAMALDNTSEFGGTDKTEIDEKSKLIYLTPVHTSSSKGNLFPTVDVARVLGQPLHGPGPAFPADVKTVRKVRGSRDPIDLTLILPDNCVRSRKRTWKLR